MIYPRCLLLAHISHCIENIRALCCLRAAEKLFRKCCKRCLNLVQYNVCDVQTTLSLENEQKLHNYTPDPVPWIFFSYCVKNTRERLLTSQWRFFFAYNPKLSRFTYYSWRTSWMIGMSGATRSVVKWSG